jgi:lipopolysaccharide export system protein LptA
LSALRSLLAAARARALESLATLLLIGGAAPLGAQTEAPATPSSPAVVTPTTGLVTIESDRQIADNSTGIVTAIGNVRILYPDRKVVATARQAQYFSREGKVVLSGDVDVVQSDGHSLRAEQLVYLVDLERIEALPASGEQVFGQYNLDAPPPGSGEPR